MISSQETARAWPVRDRCENKYSVGGTGIGLLPPFLSRRMAPVDQPEPQCPATMAKDAPRFDAANSLADGAAEIVTPDVSRRAGSCSNIDRSCFYGPCAV